MITLPPKIWRPKPLNKYIPIDYAYDVDDGIFDYSFYGKTVFRPTQRWSDRPMNDMINFASVQKEIYGSTFCNSRKSIL